MEQAALAAIETFREDFGPNSSPRPTFILVVLPDAATDIYLSVKNWGDIVRGCPTQCVVSLIPLLLHIIKIFKKIRKVQSCSEPIILILAI